MARSTYVYVVSWQEYGTHYLLGAFTVKHEMLSAVQAWVDRGGNLTGLQIERALDGDHGMINEPVDVTNQFIFTKKGN